MQKFKNQNGFAVIEVILAVLLVVAIGAAGYFAYKDHHSKAVNPQSTSSTATSGSKQAATTKAPPNPYAGWNSYTLKDVKVSFKYPTDFVLNDQTGSSSQPSGSDAVTLSKSDGFTVSIITGVGNSAGVNDTVFDAQPVSALGQNLYLDYYGTTSGVVDSVALASDNACRVCYVPSQGLTSAQINNGDVAGSVAVVASHFPNSALAVLKASADMSEATLIVQSMTY